MLLPPVTLAVLLALVGPANAPRTPQDVVGTYALRGTAHVSVSPFPARDSPGELTATLSRGSGDGALSLRLEVRGVGCTLPVRLGTEGALQFPDGARCVLDISEPEARGHLDARMTLGRGRVMNERLEMALQFEVTGSLQLKVPSRTIHVLGSDVQTPATWAPSAPVQGTIAASGEGDRQSPAGR